jgi:putative transposase
MANPLSKLLSSLTGGTKAQLKREVRFLKVENEILRSKIKGKVVPTPEDRARLVRFGRELGPRVMRPLTRKKLYPVAACSVSSHAIT